MERVLAPANLKAALARVRKNKGSPGVDGMSVDDLPGYLREHWKRLRSELLEGMFHPQPVRRAEIPKPGGGKRQLGIPTVLDRFIQQALLQVLQPDIDPGFPPHSFGLRPGRSAHDAVRQAQRLVQDGLRWVVDVDLEKFFDRVNHDILMGKLAKRIDDIRVLGLIRCYLSAGIFARGMVSERYEGTPQGGPLSPLLANVLLGEVDKELERRGHKFVRYADDCNVYVRSRAARAGASDEALRATQAPSQRGQKRRGPGDPPEAAGLLVMGEPGRQGQSPCGTQGHGRNEGTGQGNHQKERRTEHRATHHGASHVSARLEGVLPPGRHAERVQEAR
jgi:group II intron reverse transcriptase/maturase